MSSDIFGKGQIKTYPVPWWYDKEVDGGYCDFVNVDSLVDLVAVNEVSVVMLVVVIQ